MSANTRPSQSQIVLRALQAHHGSWVDMPDLAKLAGGYAIHSRIAELRRAGHVIVNETKMVEGHKKQSRYMLV